jgi:poly [ADP-ribose] polymerase
MGKSYRQAYLIKIDPVNNHNVQFIMEETPDGRLIFSKGRVGARPVTGSYKISVWDKLYEKMLKQGFVDKTNEYDMSSDKASPEPEEDNIGSDDPDVIKFVKKILSFAKKKVKETYSITMNLVTSKMLSDARDIILKMDELAKDNKEDEIDLVVAFRELQMRLFYIIPRKMQDVSEALASSRDDFEEIIKNERELLMLARSESNSEQDKKEPKKKGKSLLERFNLSIRRCTKEEEENIKKHMDRYSQPKFRRAFRVINFITEAAQKKWMDENDVTEVHFLYHGSKNFLIWAIMTMGLLLNPDAPITGKMFGWGIYFDNKAIKSLNYTSLSGSTWAHGNAKTAYLFVFKVAYKNPKHVNAWSSYMGSLDAKKIKPHDALHAHKGQSLKEDEIIVYNQAQVTIQYVIELAA